MEDNKKKATPQEEEKEQRKNSYIAFIIIILLLFAGCGVLGWLYWQERNTTRTILVEKGNLESEHKVLQAELEDMQGQYASMKTDNEELSEEMKEQQEKIERLMKEAEKHKDDAYIIYKLKKEARTLRDIMKGYVHTIDSLNTLNQQLKVEKQKITHELQTTQKKYTELEGEKETLVDKVKIGSRLKTSGLSAIAQRVRNNTVHRETNRAKRAEKIKICFTIEPNEIAKPGAKDIFIRIIDPNAKELTPDGSQDEQWLFDFTGTQGHYSIKKEIIYENEALDVCTYYDVPGELEEGDYIVEVYADEADIGKTGFSLK